MPIAIWALAAGAFGIGTTEFVVMGLLPEVARDFGISISTAGYIVTAYALGVVIGAPVLTPLLFRFPRRASLTALMSVFTIGNLACALSPSLSIMIVARVITALAHASYFGIGSVVASDLAPSGRKSSAIAAMFLGATLANIIGVPAGTLVGQVFGWRSSFMMVAGLGIIATAATAYFVPATTCRSTTDFWSELRTVLRPEMLRAFAITALGFGGTFAAFTYIAPMLTELTGVAARWVPLLMLLFGVGMAVGNPLGGRLADANHIDALWKTLGGLVVALLFLGASLHNGYLASAAVFLLGVAMFATIPPLQTNVIELGSAAPTLASSCNIAAFNLGNAGGAWLGGLAIAAKGLGFAPIAGAILTGLGLLLVLSQRLMRFTKVNFDV
jgi:DHA1 family inner membrane transport protein